MSISFGVAWLLLLLLSTLLLLLVWRSDKGARMNRPVCAKCGYEVVRLPTPICPECGADLEKVGVVQRGQRRIVPFILQLAGSAGLILAVFMIVGKTVRYRGGWNGATTPRLFPQISRKRTLSTSERHGGGGACCDGAPFRLVALVPSHKWLP